MAIERHCWCFTAAPAFRVTISNRSTLWRMDRFVEELGQVRQALGLKEVHLYGHSWGTMLATDYMLTRPTGVRSLALAGPAFSIARYTRDNDSLRPTLPRTV